MVRCRLLASEADQVVDNAEPAGGRVDALVLGEALACHAELFVTGDATLLRLAAIDAPCVVSPRRFWEILRARDVQLLAVERKRQPAFGQTVLQPRVHAPSQPRKSSPATAGPQVPAAYSRSGTAPGSLQAARTASQ